MNRPKVITAQSNQDPLLAAINRLSSQVGQLKSGKQTGNPTGNQTTNFSKFKWKDGMALCRYCQGKHLHKDCLKRPGQPFQGQQGGQQQTPSGKFFKGKCFKCQQQGHRANKCPNMHLNMLASPAVENMQQQGTAFQQLATQQANYNHLF